MIRTRNAHRIIAISKLKHLQNWIVGSANSSKYGHFFRFASILLFSSSSNAITRISLSSIYLVPFNGCQSSQCPLLTSLFRVTQFSSRHWILFTFSPSLRSSLLSSSKFRLHLQINFIALGSGTVVVDDVVYSVLSKEINDIFFHTKCRAQVSTNAAGWSDESRVAV